MLINSTLINMILNMISFFRLSKGVAQRLDYYFSRFFLQEDNEKNNYLLGKWSVVCQPKRSRRVRYSLP
jgi:hypothetical protein